MRLLLIYIVSFSFFNLSNSQSKEITLEKIWDNEFRSEYLDHTISMKDGKHYSVLVQQRSKLDVFSYATQEKVKTIIDADAFEQIKTIDAYAFSKDEKKIIISTNSEAIYRHSVLANSYLFDVQTKKITPISDYKIQEPTFSPDNSKIAYVYKNNLYVYYIHDGTTRQITQDGKKNHIINGLTDWVYEEEFGFVKAFEWNESSTQLAYIKFDESEVPFYTMDFYTNADLLYPSKYTFKYPKAGEQNSRVSLHLYHFKDDKTMNIDVGNPYYVPKIKWTKKDHILSIQTLNRHQNSLQFIYYNSKTQKSRIILKETDNAYVSVLSDTFLHFFPDNTFIWLSEKNNHTHLYHYGATGILKTQITKGNWDITNVYGYDPATKKIYFQSTENGPINRDVFSIGLDGKIKKQLSQTKGTNSAIFSADFSYYINVNSSTESPYTFSLYKTKTNKKIKDLINNDLLKKKLSSYNLHKKEFKTISINGYDLNMWEIKPKNFDPQRSYPLLMYQYSGPGSQQVANKWFSQNDFWHQMLANMGYVIVCVDGRGTGYKGAEFKKMTYKQLGKYEVEDQIAVAQKLAQLPYIDAKRIGIWGWSYGGFMSSNCILQGNDIFSLAIAVAPVISWRYYDTIYTERYMQTPQENPSGYDDNSPISHVDKLKGKYLLIHGSADDNVHLQNSMVMIEKLIQANKEFDWLIYPDKNHAIYGGYTRLNLYKKMTDFILKNL